MQNVTSEVSPWNFIRKKVTGIWWVTTLLYSSYGIRLNFRIWTMPSNGIRKRICVARTATGISGHFCRKLCIRLPSLWVLAVFLIHIATCTVSAVTPIVLSMQKINVSGLNSIFAPCKASRIWLTKKQKLLLPKTVNLINATSLRVSKRGTIQNGCSKFS